MNYNYSILCVKMLPVGIGYWVAVGSACCISGIYFYCTYRGQRCYYDDEVADMNRTRINDGDGV